MTEQKGKTVRDILEEFSAISRVSVGIMSTKDINKALSELRTLLLERMPESYINIEGYIKTGDNYWGKGWDDYRKEVLSVIDGVMESDV